MTIEAAPTEDDRRADSPARRIDAACDRFEAAWRDGQHPQIEDLLHLAADTERQALLRELITLEVELRRSRGEHAALGEYRDRFPGQTAVVDDALAETDLGPRKGQPTLIRKDASRGLLLGLLALQNDFIDRDALLSAFATWVADRSRPLGQILLEIGALSPGRQMLLEALVAEHLKLHGDDPETSLAALSSIASVRDDLSRVANRDVQHSLSHVSAARTNQDDDPYRTATHPSSRDAAYAGTRFRILRPHAKGGLGEVFVALDTELNRDVALKEIQNHLADDPRYRARFEFEAEVTGGLEHPGIVPVYGLGHTQSGRPYYAMRLIKGISLKDAIQQFHEAEKQPRRDSGQSTLELRNLLGRFIDVCDAVAYAHSRGVLHRDIKPSNIMLGKYGETLVVDWGVAKALDRPEAEIPIDRSELPLRPSPGSSLEPTEAGSAVGTPAYMSPEQASGQLDPLGPRSDVYCLGATLYHLLTGRAPCEGGQVGEVYRKVLSGAIPRPRALDSRIAPGLEAICLKALALRPSNRYESAEAFKADLERWLADEPVSAYREPISTRAGRWVRRHKPLLAAVAVLLASTLVGLLISNQMMRRQRDMARQARDDAIRAEAKTDEARREAERARQSAAGASSEAEASLGLARSAVKKMLVKVADDRLPHVPQMGPLRKDVAIEALQFAREFLRRRPSDPAVRTEAAMILRRVANIERLTGDFPAALPHYEEAEALYGRLTTDFPGIPAYLDLLSELELDFAEALKMAARPGDASIHYGKADEIARRQLADRPDDPSFRRTLARIQNDFGLALFEAGRTREGLKRCDESVAIFKDLSHRQPLLHRADPLLSLMSLVDRTPLQRDAGNLNDAEESLAQAVSLARALLEKDSTDDDARYYLAAALCEQGTLWAEERGKPVEAEAAFDESVRHFAALRTGSSDVFFYRSAHAEAQSGRGGARAALSRLKEADEDCHAAQLTLEALLSEIPHDAKAMELVASTLARRARIARARGDRVEANRLWNQSLGRQKALVNLLPDNPRARGRLERLSAESERQQSGDRP